MIIVRITSGLGNQMFQYAFYQLMRERYKDTPVKADLTWFNGNEEHHGYELERIFGQGADGAAKNSSFKIEEASTKEILRVTGKIPCFIKGKAAKKFETLRRYPNRILKVFNEEKCRPYQIHELELCNPDASSHLCIDELYEQVMNLDTSKDWYLAGFWIEERYYKDRIKKLQKHFVFPEVMDEENQKWMEQIKATESVSIHVRRGDYLTSYSKDFIALGSEYYKAAIAYICQHVEHPTFYLFSDDVEFVKKEFSFLDESYVITHNSGENSFRDMQLMSLCRHNIVANSTFSQWGALLNANEDNLTIYPKQYMRQKDNERKSLKNWVRL